MARKPRPISRYQKEQAKGDVRFNSHRVRRFSSFLMWDGKRALAERTVCRALDFMYERFEKTQEEKSELSKDDRIMELLDMVIDKSRPNFEVKSRRIGGANYQIPVEVSRLRQEVLVLRWIIEFARKRKGDPAWRCVGQEMLDVLQDRGSVLKAKSNLESMARANLAFYKKERKKDDSEERVSGGDR